MDDLNSGMVTSETLARQLFDAGLAPDGVTSVLGQKAMFTRIARNTRMHWLPATEIADVWHLVLRYRISILFPLLDGEMSKTVLSSGRPVMETERLVYVDDIPLAIGLLAMRIRQQELAKEQETIDGQG